MNNNNLIVILAGILGTVGFLSLKSYLSNLLSRKLDKAEGDLELLPLELDRKRAQEEVNRLEKERLKARSDYDNSKKDSD